MANKKCCLCNGKIDDKYGHNAMPLKEGLCCSRCNYQKVIPARLKDAGLLNLSKTIKKISRCQGCGYPANQCVCSENIEER